MLAREDPAALSELSRKAASCPARMAKPRTRPMGTPLGMTKREYAQASEKARLIALRIYKKMELEDALPENPIARKAMKNALELLALDQPAKDRLATIRTLLEYNMAKPASTQNVNVKTAEDFLDELAADDS